MDHGLDALQVHHVAKAAVFIDARGGETDAQINHQGPMGPTGGAIQPFDPVSYVEVIFEHPASYNCQAADPCYEGSARDAQGPAKPAKLELLLSKCLRVQSSCHRAVFMGK